MPDTKSTIAFVTGMGFIFLVFAYQVPNRLIYLWWTIGRGQTMRTVVTHLRFVRVWLRGPHDEDHREWFGPPGMFVKIHPQIDHPFGVHASSTSLSQIDASASLGIRQSPLGDKLTEPTFGPSGTHDRLN